MIPKISEGFTDWFVSLAATFNMIFGGFLNFVVPLIIVAFIAPGIAKLGKGSGKLLGLATGFAYFSTIVAGILAFFQHQHYCLDLSEVLAMMILKMRVEQRQNHFSKIEMTPIMGVMSALLLAFVSWNRDGFHW